MTTDGKIYIVVTDKLPTQNDTIINSGGVSPSTGSSSKKSENELFDHWARTRLLNSAKQLGTSVVNYQLTHYGNFTGDYITQAGINENLSMVNNLMNIGLGALSGAKYGPVGAVIGASLGVINAVTSTALNIHTMRLNTAKTNYEIAQLRDRSGMNSLLDGSRGTEN